MKKSELKKLIKEAITEQMGSYLGAAINYDQNAGAQQIMFSLCQCEIIDQQPFTSGPYTDLDMGCCQSLTLSVNGNYHGTGNPLYDITTKGGGLFWTAIQNAQAGNTSGHQGIYADPNHCFNSCPTNVDLTNPDVANPSYSGDGCYQNSYQNGVPACPHAQTAPTVEGCTDSTANNYDPNATTDDGSCDFTCTDPLYVECGTPAAGPCNQLVSFTQDAINNTMVEGCADSSATNYDPNATGCLMIGGSQSTGSYTTYIAPGEIMANACGATLTGITDPDNTDCCTYSSTSGNTNYMPGGVGNVTGPTGPTATLSTKDMDLSKPPQAGGSSADMTAKKDRIQKLANIKPRRKK
tara:strand:- start:241 stop:1296 length:1056 start_codon:yes stop_codon:yes gene_type:complete